MRSRFRTLEQTMEQVGAQRRSESAWREIVARQTQSGLTVQSFCEREGINVASLYGWRSRLREDTSNAGVSGSGSRTKKDQKSRSEFIDLGALSKPAPRFEVRLDLGGGVLLQLVRG
jgi:putative transposase